MALMVDIKPTEYKGEEMVWESLARNLPDDIIVYNHREVASDREFDFALLIKGMGVLIIEVKGWKAQYIFAIENPDEIIMEGESRPLKSPEKQARGYRFEWLNFLQDKFSVSPVVLSMVCYPFITEKEYFAKRLDIISNKDFTLFSEDLRNAERLGKKISNIFARKKLLNSTPMDDDTITMIRQYFEPAFKIKDVSSCDISEQYSFLKIFGRRICDDDIHRLLQIYFSGTKIIIFFHDNTDLEKFSDRLCREIAAKKIVLDNKGNFQSAGSAEIQSPFKIDGECLRVFHLEAYVQIECYDGMDDIEIVEGKYGDEIEQLLDKLARCTIFNFQQYKVEHAPTDSNILVEAGAGTGKTYSMVSRIAFLCNRRNTSVRFLADEIAMVTFTNEAADNMKSRLKQYFMNCYMLTRKQRNLHQIEEVDLMQISTIHKFAKVVIQSVAISYGLGSDFAISSSEYAKEQVYEKYLNEYLVRKQGVQPNFVQQLHMPVHKFRKLLMKFTAQLYNKSCSIKDLTDSELGTFDEWPFFNEVIRDVMIPAELEYEDIVFSKNKIDLKESMLLLNDAVSGAFREKCDLKFKYIFIVLVNNCVGFSLSPFYGTQKVIAYDYPMKCEAIIT